MEYVCKFSQNLFEATSKQNFESLLRDATIRICTYKKKSLSKHTIKKILRDPACSTRKWPKANAQLANNTKSRNLTGSILVKSLTLKLAIILMPFNLQPEEISVNVES